MQKHVNLVDLVKSFPTNIYLQNLASIQKRTSPVKFAHLAEKSGKGSISNLSTKATGPTPLTRSTLAACLFPPVECREWFCPSSPSAGCSEAGDSHCCPSTADMQKRKLLNRM